MNIDLHIQWYIPHVGQYTTTDIYARAHVRANIHLHARIGLDLEQSCKAVILKVVLETNTGLWDSGHRSVNLSVKAYFFKENEGQFVFICW